MPTLSWIVLVFLPFAVSIDAETSAPQISENYDYDYYLESTANDTSIDYSDECVCVPFYRCEDGKITEDGTNRLKPRRLKPRDSSDANVESLECELDHVCCGQSESVEARVKPTNQKCGHKSPILMNRKVVNSKATAETQFGEWPWQAMILQRNEANFNFVCGGTLIDDQHVLTAAHCITRFLDKNENLVARLGEWDTRVATELLPHENFNVTNVFVHPDYRSRNYKNDIAILELETAVDFKPHINIACLPRNEDNFTGQTCVVTGWGQDAFSGSFRQVLKKVALPVIGHSECQERLRNTILGPRFKLHPGFFCAGGKEGEDACSGDGGGPLVCSQPDDTYILAGIVSWGLECGTKDVPGVYVNVQKYLNWITSITGKPVEEYWESD